MLELVGESDRTVFLEFPVAQVAIPDAGIVEAGIEEQIGRDILRYSQFKGILPFYLSALIGSKGLADRKSVV